MMLPRTWILLWLAGRVLAGGPAWAPGRLCLHFPGDPDMDLVRPGLQAEPALAGLLARLPEARLLPLYSGNDPILRQETAGVRLLLMDPARDPREVAAWLLDSGLVEAAEPDWLLPLRRVPDDPLLDSQWNLEAVRAFEAWDLLPDPAPGEAVVIALLDSGVDWERPELRERLWQNPGEDLDGDGALSPDGQPGDPDDRNGLDDDGNGVCDDFLGWDFVDGAAGVAPGEDGSAPDNDPRDRLGHGTGVAGLAAAHTDNGLELATLAWEARVMALRVAYQGQDGNGYVLNSAALSALYYAIGNGARVVNLSFGGSASLRTAASLAWNHGLLCVHSVHDQLDLLDQAEGMLSVAASTAQDCNLTCVADVELLAPGLDIPTLDLDGTQLTSGASFAAPQVAGLAALLWRLHPELDNQQVRRLLLEGADPVGQLACNAACSPAVGRLNALHSLELAAGRVREPATRPRGAHLAAVRPNPFNPICQVELMLERRGQVRLTVHDLLGRQLALLVDGRLSAGRHHVPLRATGWAGGLYLLRLEEEDGSGEARKLLYLP